MPGVSIADADSPIRIVVTPTQSSYFAGETFSVKVTFTNTRSPEAVSSKPSSYSHKRGSHSISSAPLARPPTSPGPPRATALPSALKQKGTKEAPRRKHFIGKTRQSTVKSHSSEHLPDLIEQRRKRQLAPKSLSVSISPYELQETLGGALSAPHSQRSFNTDTRNTNVPRTSSPLARTDTLNLSSNHPHARKRSILDGQFSLDYLSPTTSVPPPPYTPNSSTSSFTLALDPIAEGAQSPYPSTPAIGSPTIESTFLPPHTPETSSNVVYGYSTTRQQRPASLGLGQPPRSPRVPPRPASEVILYSYAQLTGTLIMTPEPGEASTLDQIQALNSIRSALLNRTVLGGGSMDITSSLNSPNPTSPKSPRFRHTHSRSSSLSAGLLSIFSPTSLASSLPSPNPNSAKWRSTSGHMPSLPSSAKLVANGSSSSPSVFGLGFGNNTFAISSNIDPEEPLPTFEVQPAMLAVDLSLVPGESRSYVYSLKLPENLPPTFKGRSLKFSYELVVGTCRAIPTSSAGGGGLVVGPNSVSRVMKVPIRVYNNVSVTKTIQPYDLLWPVRMRRDVNASKAQAMVEEDTGSTGVPSVPQLPSLLPTSNTLESIKDYAQSLLKTLAERTPEMPESHLPDRPQFPISSRSSFYNQDETMGGIMMNGNGNAQDLETKHRNGKEPIKPPRSTRVDDIRWAEVEREKVAEGGLTGCREAVEILTRNPKKVSYDVNKDGIKVAVLTFTKSAYRLGETITGVVEINEKSSRARVLKVSSILECHESLPPIVSSSNVKLLRRSYAEAHSSFTLNTLRTTFTLDIPSDASPAFQIYVDSMDDGRLPSASSFSRTSSTTVGGLVWKVRLCLLVGIATGHSIVGPHGTRFRTLNRDGPRGEWGSSWIATPASAPLERVDSKAAQHDLAKQQISSPRSWSYLFVSSLLGRSSEIDPVEVGKGDDNDDSTVLEKLRTSISSVDYDGIIPDPAGGVGTGVNYLWDDSEEGWRTVKLETVECEVPIKVFPSNTAFKALDVVFDV